MFHAGENARTNRAGQKETPPPGRQSRNRNTRATQGTFYETTHGEYEGNHAGLLLPPSMGRVPFSDLSLNAPPAASNSSVPAAMERRKAPRLALTQSTLLAAERQTAWHDKLRYASSSDGSHNGSNTVGADDSYSVANDIPPANDEDDGEPEPSSEEWEKRRRECFNSAENFSKHIKAWASKILGTVRPIFLDEDEKGHWYCDVDLTTGKTLDPILFPDTHRDETPLEDAGAAWRRRTQTAASVSRKYVLHMENQPSAEGLPDTDQLIGGGVRLHEHEGPRQGARLTKITNEANVPSTPAQDPKPELPQSPAIEIKKPGSPAPAVEAKKPAAPAPAVETKKSAATAPAVEAKKPAATGPAVFAEGSSTGPCYMRRAEKKDLVGVLNIYNREVIKGTQAPDTDVLAPEDVVRIWQTCQDRGLPFLVAVEGRTGMGQDEQVVGFGFFSDAQPGLSGKSRTSGPLSVKANVYVKTSHRQRGLGSALLDRLLIVSSQNYVASAKGASPITFLDAGRASVRERPIEYWNVFVEILCGSPVGLAETWYERVLTDRFGFESPGSFTKDVHWSPATQCWLGRLVFRHDCRCANSTQEQEPTQGDAPKAPHGGRPDRAGNGGLRGSGAARVGPASEFW